LPNKPSTSSTKSTDANKLPVEVTPSSPAPVMKQDSSRQEGLMLNILEAIEPQSSKAADTVCKSNADRLLNGKNLQSSRPNRYKRRLSPSTSEPRAKHSASGMRSNQNSRTSNFTRQPNHGSKPTCFSSPSNQSSRPTVFTPQPDQAKNTTVLSQQHVKPMEPGAEGEVKNMQEALVISQELEVLRQKQIELESQLNTIQTQLNEFDIGRLFYRPVPCQVCMVFTVDLFSPQSEFSRVRLVRSESDEDDNCSNVSTSVPEQPSHSRRPLISTNAPTIAPVNLTQAFSTIPPVHASQQWPTSVFPLVNPPEHQKHAPIPNSAMNSTISFATPPSTSLIQTRTKNPSSTLTPTMNHNPLIHPARQSETHHPSQTKVVPPIPSAPTSGSETATIPNSTHPSSVPNLFSRPTSDVPGGPPGVDLERLALIRQALQSPDSWQFTFEDVDRMLQQAAAKASAKQQAQTDNCTTGLQLPTVQSNEPTRLITSNPATSTSQSPVHRPPICVKGEPIVNTNPPASACTTLSVPPDHPILKPTEPCTSSSSSFDSSEDELPTHRPAQPKVKRLVKPDPTHAHSTLKDAPGPTTNHPLSRSSSNPPPEMPTITKDLVKYGEFHAFDGQTTAVIDMVVHPSSWSIFIGGQSGAVAQFDLKTHVCIRRIATKDASVTQMALEPSERSLFVGYYDNCLAEFDTRTGALLFEKYFAQRIVAIAVPPLRDVSFLYFGMSNGDILRHDIGSRSVSVLYDRSLNCSDSNGQAHPTVGISSMAIVQSGARLLLIVGDQERNLIIHAASDGSTISVVRSAPHKGPPQGIKRLPFGSLFCAYSERAVRVHNWRTGTGVMTLQTSKVTSSCVTERYLALGDSEGTHNGLPHGRPMKVYFATSRAAITSLVGCGEALIAGSLDGTVTTIWVNEPANNHICLVCSVASTPNNAVYTRRTYDNF
uniref:WD_REPEATS_REGION domain-containing protein n=1 Tax=Echinostoma caproni TaxID=27848 RepID=A0A183AFY1_9TREM